MVIQHYNTLPEYLLYAGWFPVRLLGMHTELSPAQGLVCSKYPCRLRCSVLRGAFWSWALMRTPIPSPSPTFSPSRSTLASPSLSLASLLARWFTPAQLSEGPAVPSLLCPYPVHTVPGTERTQNCLWVSGAGEARPGFPGSHPLCPEASCQLLSFWVSLGQEWPPGEAADELKRCEKLGKAKLPVRASVLQRVLSVAWLC